MGPTGWQRSRTRLKGPWYCDGTLEPKMVSHTPLHVRLPGCTCSARNLGLFVASAEAMVVITVPARSSIDQQDMESDQNWSPPDVGRRALSPSRWCTTKDRSFRSHGTPCRLLSPLSPPSPCRSQDVVCSCAEKSSTYVACQLNGGASRCRGVLGLAGGLGSYGNGFLASIL